MLGAGTCRVQHVAARGARVETGDDDGNLRALRLDAPNERDHRTAAASAETDDEGRGTFLTDTLDERVAIVAELENEGRVGLTHREPAAKNVVLSCGNNDSWEHVDLTVESLTRSL
jgi:hypothetical protein